MICRTSRGLEVGEVLAPADQIGDGGASDGSLLRRKTVEDELLIARIERHKDRAYQACREMLAERGISAVLLDVEHLFDGQSLYFYFLGEVTPEVEAVTAALADVYEANVQFRKFAETLSQGCGSGCGTEEASGGGCGSHCVTCVAVGHCAVKTPDASAP